MANLRLATATRNALADAFSTLVDAAGEAGSISFYAGTQPANANTDPGGDHKLLGVLKCSTPAADRSISGVVSFNTIAEDPSAPNSGITTWARITDGHGNAVFDCDVTGPGGGGTIEINSTDIVEGGPVRIRGFTITFPAG